MLHSKQVCAIHMVNGAIVLGGDVTLASNGMLQVTQPVNLAIRQHPDSNAIDMQMVPMAFPFYKSLKDQPVHFNFVVGNVFYWHALNEKDPDHKDMIEKYKSCFSSIIQPSALGIGKRY